MRMEGGFCAFGASGHGLAIGSFLEQAFGPLGLGPLVAFIDDGEGGRGRLLAGSSIVSLEEWRARWRYLRCVAGVGSPGGRRAVVGRLRQAGAEFGGLYEKYAADLYPRVAIAEGAVIGGNVHLGPLTAIGEHVQVLANASVGHDVTIGAFATICPDCAVSGHVEIGEGAFLDAGSVVRNGRRGRPLRIGRDAVLVAGSVATMDVPDAARWSGNPARPLRELALRCRRAGAGGPLADARPVRARRAGRTPPRRPAARPRPGGSGLTPPEAAMALALSEVQSCANVRR